MRRTIFIVLACLTSTFVVAQVACPPPSDFCGEGTTWDDATQTCIVAFPSDSNFDGCVQLNDLLDLLSAFGAQCGAWQCGTAEWIGEDDASR